MRSLYTKWCHSIVRATTAFSKLKEQERKVEQRVCMPSLKMVLNEGLFVIGLDSYCDSITLY